MVKGMKDFVAAAKAKVAEVSTEEVASMQNDSVLLLDVREPGEYQAGYLPGAINVPRGLLEVKADPEMPPHDVRLTDREQAIIAYCASGGRSLLAAATLLEMGFTKVKSMAGGFGAWQQEGREIVRG
ncbi:MAG: rhodanese-like domain-containing protein [Mariprofundaceae bacterium]|nr:rhodanese-like domain-containing protein [Mariprofundaceae bacterium]